jgi:hypothetical protein
MEENQRNPGQAGTVFCAVSGQNLSFQPETRQLRAEIPLDFGIQR